MATSSRRGYLTIQELQDYANIQVTNQDEGYDQISQAEELIDSYVGPQQKFIGGSRAASNGSYRPAPFAEEATPRDLVGKSQGGPDSTKIKLQADQIGSNGAGYYVGCEAEILGGGAAGNKYRITDSTSDGVLSLEGATGLNNQTIYRIAQLGKFPRSKDVYFDGGTQKYYKSIPEAVRRATAAQVEYMITMGEKFFSGGDSDMTGESFGDYSYTRNGSLSPSSSMIAPKARTLLRGIMNRKGRLIA